MSQGICRRRFSAGLPFQSGQHRAKLRKSQESARNAVTHFVKFYLNQKVKKKKKKEKRERENSRGTLELIEFCTMFSISLLLIVAS